MSKKSRIFRSFFSTKSVSYLGNSPKKVSSAKHPTPLLKVSKHVRYEPQLTPRFVNSHHDSVVRNQAKYILVMNSKGGSGKTTISTNIASFLAAQSTDNHVILVDHDRQGSSVRWLKVRPSRHRHIDGIYPARDNLVKFKRTWRLLVRTDATHVVIDSPAGLSDLELSDRIRESQVIVIPVMPSAIDIAATADFVSKIFTNPAYINSKKAMCVVANGVNKNMHSYENLERFLFSLHIPFVSVFNDSKQYILAAEHGCGINELPKMEHKFEDISQWEKLIHWIETR